MKNKPTVKKTNKDMWISHGNTHQWNKRNKCPVCQRMLKEAKEFFRHKENII